MRVEDGFLRSRGLGAELIPPLSLVTDTSGIYYDPTSPSDLEQLIADSPSLSNAARDRAKTVIRAVTASKLSKYNLQRDTPQLPDGHRILVPGQVEDDASIRLGTLDVTTNRDLLLAARDARPDAVILYKPHPDVEAGLRDGDVADATEIADMVVQNGDPIALIDAVREVWTMTSLLGFEALLRGVPVTCLGQPFYSGWGLTTDRHPHPRRTARLISPLSPTRF